jgi:AraC-like DNA-binding protein
MTACLDHARKSIASSSQVARPAGSGAVPQPHDGTAITSYQLRDHIRLCLIRPDRPPPPPIELAMDGSYLAVALSGTANVWADQGNQPLASGRLHVLRQGRTVSRRWIEVESSTTLAVLAYFPTQWCLDCPRGRACKVGRFLMQGEARAGDDQSFDLDSRGLAIARSLIDTHIDDDGDFLTAEQSVLALLSWAFVQMSIAPVPKAMPTPLHPQAALKVRQAADILRRRVDDPPTIAELASAVGMNDSDLKRCFKCLYGDGIASYSRRQRLEAGRDLLIHSPLGVAAIALEVGFSNPSQFARAFRRQFGRNPDEFRRSPP